MSSFAQDENHIDMQKKADQIDDLFAKPKEIIDGDWGYFNHRNCIKVDLNGGAFISKISGVDYKGKRGMSGLGASIAYENITTSGFGFGMNGILESGEEGFNTGFVGPAALWVKPIDNVVLTSSIGFGMGAIWYDSKSFGKEDHGGFAFYFQFEGAYRINKWLGLGAGIRLLNIRCAKPEWVKDIDYKNYGTSSIRLTVGPRFFF